MATSLILPWFDYGKTYRPVAEAIAKALPADHGCLAERGLSDTQLASLAYFIGIEADAADSAAGQEMRLAPGHGQHETGTGRAGCQAGPASGKAIAPPNARKSSASTGAENAQRELPALKPSGNARGST